MGAGKQRWWRDYEAECREWSDRDVRSRTVYANGVEVTVYKNGSTVIVNQRLAPIVMD
jgi:hypothetical protein